MDTLIAERLKHYSQALSNYTSSAVTGTGTTVSNKHPSYIDFCSGTGHFNYGHRNPVLWHRLATKLRQLGPLGRKPVSQTINQLFLRTVRRTLLRPRGWHYAIYPGADSGSATLERALALARLHTRRNTVVSFSAGFSRANAESVMRTTKTMLAHCADHVAANNITFLPYDRCFGPDVDTMACLEQFLAKHYGKSTLPAAIVVETVLGNGGINVLTWRWLRDLAVLCQEYGIVLIMDDTQVGCGRTGHFFSFESAGIQPDMIVLGKSLSGFGVPLSLLLVKSPINPSLGGWQGALEGWHDAVDQDLAMLTATITLQTYWDDTTLTDRVLRKEAVLRDWLEAIVPSYPAQRFRVRGRGLIQGLVTRQEAPIAGRIASYAREAGLLLETSGLYDEVIKLQPPLTITHDQLLTGLDRLEHSIALASGVAARSTLR